ncbi:hypothetical protein EVAR_16915_1 [Eumeta japonica]|uniref:Uncharacterized protein n=1 Tax=Eumeta variegata TaxID=151549 RepID=A0A4C1TVA6_EUMVA|nr:hypothetical protein EVAR_16915_1 [Eumeta japonica]
MEGSCVRDMIYHNRNKEEWIVLDWSEPDIKIAVDELHQFPDLLKALHQVKKIKNARLTKEARVRHGSLVPNSDSP